MEVVTNARLTDTKKVFNKNNVFLVLTLLVRNPLKADSDELVGRSNEQYSSSCTVLILDVVVLPRGTGSTPPLVRTRLRELPLATAKAKAGLQSV